VARQSCEITLKDFADELGTSSRMLVHHFGSRDALIAAGLAHARGQLLGTCRERLAGERPQDLRSLVAALRGMILDPGNRPYFRLFDQVNALAQTDPQRFPGFARAGVHDWLPQLTELLTPSSIDEADAQAGATLALAIIRGLMLDENATRETPRIDAALAAFNGAYSIRAPDTTARLERMRVRRATRDDVEAMAGIIAKVAEEGLLGAEPPVDVQARADRFREALTSEARDAGWILERDGQTVGHATVAERARGVLHLGMAILPEGRGQGGGRALLRSVDEYARGCGAHKIDLEVWTDTATCAVRWSWPDSSMRGRAPTPRGLTAVAMCHR
jgi:N-acetylglutamate synthase-like GNAT family acetyltransferase